LESRVRGTLLCTSGVRLPHHEIAAAREISSHDLEPSPRHSTKVNVHSHFGRSPPGSLEVQNHPYSRSVRPSEWGCGQWPTTSPRDL
ncbi:hypothetical protein FRB90_007248, partial [Tulasnella sp. 427]